MRGYLLDGCRIKVHDLNIDRSIRGGTPFLEQNIWKGSSNSHSTSPCKSYSAISSANLLVDYNRSPYKMDLS